MKWVCKFKDKDSREKIDSVMGISAMDIGNAFVDGYKRVKVTIELEK